MRSAPFNRADLFELDERLFWRAGSIRRMDEIGRHWKNTIGLRHDVDHDLETAVRLSDWEWERGYTSTYFVLHTAGYYADRGAVAAALERIAVNGHEIGFHCNAVAAAVHTGEEPAAIVEREVAWLRSLGHPVKGTVAHGDSGCYNADGSLRFVNDEMFTECYRPGLGDYERLGFGSPLPLADFGFEYDANRLPRSMYLSDSGGKWTPDFDVMAAAFPHPEGQLHVLWHPCWWKEAFA